MGMFDFVKSVGKKLGIGGEEAAPTADTLKKELDSHKLGTDGVEVVVKGDTAVLKGVVKDQSIFEKAVIAVGNTLGVSKVQADELQVATPDSGPAAAAPAKEPISIPSRRATTSGRSPRRATARARASRTRSYSRPTSRC
jgi:hypothetical protein